MIFGRFILRPDSESIFPLGFEALILDEDLPQKSLKLIPWARESGEPVLLVHNWTVEDGLASASTARMEVCDPGVHLDFTAADAELVRQHRT